MKTKIPTQLKLCEMSNDNLLLNMLLRPTLGSSYKESISEPGNDINKSFSISSITLGLLLLLTLSLSVTVGFSQTIQYYETGEEFAGPFPSWKNVKTDFGAKGDGTTDDAPAIQAALDAMRTTNTNNWSVLYFPAGTYRIGSTLKTLRTGHNDFMGINIIGEDPATTILSWAGPSGQHMLSLDAWYAKVGRLTFDGKGTVATGLLRDGGFSTYCELNDLFFKDMSVGISLGGSTGEGQAEHAIERCRFTRCSKAGIESNNFNVIDIYIWSSLFEDCGRGVMNNAGSYNVVDNVFLRSTVADLTSDNSMTFVILNNTSIDSRTFMRFPAGLSHVQGNKIYNTLDAVAIPTANSYGGAPTLIGNTIRSRSGNTGAAVTAPYGNHLFVDNTFTVNNPVSGGGRIFSANQRIVDASTIVVPSVLQLPGTPPNRKRKIFEVRSGTGNDANEIQQKINAAANEPAGSNPVVHIPKGNFTINTTIAVPTNAMLIVGDGGSEHGTVIRWSGSGAGPGFRLAGPSRVTMRDMMINFGGSGGADAIVVENSDQVGGRVFCDQVVTSGNSSNSKCYNAIFVDGVENSDVTYINGGWGEYTNAGVLVKGGSTLSSGGSTNGQVSLLLGALGNNENKIIDVEDGGRVLAYGFRDEMPVSGTILNLGATNGAVSVAGMSWAATPSTTTPFININGYRGTLAYVGNGIGTGYGEVPGSLFIKIAGDGSNANILSGGNVFGSRESTTVATTWKDNSNPKANATFLNNSGAGVNQPLVNIPNVVNQVVDAPVNPDFVLNTLSQIRSLRVDPLMPKPSGVTDVRLIRLFVKVGNGRTGLTFKSNGGSSGSNVAPVVNITSPVSNAAFTAGSNVTINANASDVDGSVRKVEFYQGAVKLGEDTTSPYSFTWDNVTAGNYNLTARATDNGGSVTTSSIVSIIVNAAPSTGTDFMVFTTQTPDGSANDQPYELGMKFQSAEAGTITKVRYYKMSRETGTHTGRIWTAGGTQLASVVFSNETASGWQEATLNTPLAITANTVYVVSVNSNSNYAITSNALGSSIVNGPLSSIAGSNGVFNTTPGSFPTASWNNSNYFRDVVFVKEEIPVITTNLAFQKPATTDSYLSGFPGSLAVDGSNSGNGSRWVSANTAWPHWIEVDLQGTYTISKINFWTGHNGYNRPVGYKFQRWTGSAWADIVYAENNTSSAVEREFTAVTTNRVRLYGVNGSDNHFRLYELQVWGTPVSGARFGAEETPASEALGLQLFPNPAASTLTLSGSLLSGSTVQIFNASGLTVLTQSLTGDMETLEIAHLPAGMYIVRVTSEGKVEHKKFLKL